MGDQEIATTSCKVSLACPLGKMRMNAPCRASTCDHLQCFDAQLYLQMNEKKPKWVCPVCNKHALVENLLIDGFFMELIKSPRLPADEHEIVLHNDGTWDPLPPKQEDLTTVTSRVPAPASSQQVEDTVNLDDSEEEEVPEEPSTSSGAGTVTVVEAGPSGGVTRSLSGDAEDHIITLDSDSDEEEAIALPIKKRARIEPSNDAPGSPELICLDDDDE